MKPVRCREFRVFFRSEDLILNPLQLLTNDPSLSRMTIVSSGNDRVLEQIVKQLNKLIEVVKVSDLTSQDHIERDLMLVKICPTKKDNFDLKQLVDVFSCKIVDVTDKTYTIEISGKTKKLNAFLDTFDPASILEVSRTGVTGISRGKKLI